MTISLEGSAGLQNVRSNSYHPVDGTGGDTETKTTAAGLGLNAAVVDAVAMAMMRIIQRRISVTAANPTTLRA